MIFIGLADCVQWVFVSGMCQLDVNVQTCTNAPAVPQPPLEAGNVRCP